MSEHIECERKFLIRMPDLARLRAWEGVRESEIAQTYLSAPVAVTARVRARTENGVTTYTHTEKIRSTVLSAIEREREISREEYDELLKTKDPERQTIFKTRFVLPYEGHFCEIDVYPFWQKQAVLEVELQSEEEAFSLPDLISVIREVSGEKAYKNALLARSIPREEE